ncbi:MAG: FAD-binding oxidoreductase [Lachnospiraceae bacterium]
MNREPDLSELSAMRFWKLGENRKAALEGAGEAVPEQKFWINDLAAQLHPGRQYAKIADIRVWDANCRSYVFVPDRERGTENFAYFQAGSYVSVFLESQGMKFTRPYSISSSPRQALAGALSITVKRVPGGAASNLILDTWKVGDAVTLSGPLGEFRYDPVRDGKTILALAGGSGITPFYSLARAIAEGEEDADLILLYGSRTERDILFREEFAALQKECGKIRVVHVLSDEEKAGYEHGFLNAALIEKYAPQEDYSIWLCGPAGMYAFLDGELKKLPKTYRGIRHELQGEFHNPQSAPDYPGGEVPEEVKLTVHVRDQVRVISAKTKDSILQSLERNGIAAPSRCRSGECGYCHTRLLSGEVFAPKAMEHRRQADHTYGYVHACCTFPLTDLEIDVPPAESC